VGARNVSGEMRQFSYAEALRLLAALRDDRGETLDRDAHGFVQFCLANAAHSHGQFLQDLWVTYELRALRYGFFVDFGAADGAHASNSLVLERELGWRGIVAEPARVWSEALRQNRRCAIDTRCVWSRSGETVTFNQTPQALHSTIDDYSASDGHAASRTEGERYPVETVSLMDLLKTWDAPARIDYLSLDTEGSELDILQAFDFSAYEVRLITVEHNHTDRRRPIYDLLTSKGFVRKFDELSGVDDWYVKIQA
jgi:FkbM family methyltransferase